jgi:predicted dehydrogenase
LDRLKSLANEVGNPAVFTDYAAMLRDADVGVAIIASPDHLHCPMALEAARAGKGVICEKPLGLNLDEATRMVDAVRKAGVGDAVNFQHRYAPSVQEVKRRLEGGSLGEIVAFHSCISVPLPDLMPVTWRQRRGNSAGGAMADCGSHLVDIANWLFGATPGRAIACNGIVVPRRPSVPDLNLVEAWGWAVEHKDGLPAGIEMVEVETPDYSQILLEYSGNRLATIRVQEAEMLARIGPYIAIEVHCEKATALCEVDWGMQGLGRLRVFGAAAGEVPLPDTDFAAWMGEVIGDALSAVEARSAGRAHGFPSFEDGVKVQRVLDAAGRSVAEGRWVEVAPEG